MADAENNGVNIQAVSTQKRNLWKWIFGILALVFVLLGVGIYLVFGVNQFYLEIHIQGDPEINLEYGNAYMEPGADILLRGSLILKEGIEPEDVTLDIDTDLQEDTVGKYYVTYSASYHGLSASAERIIRVVDPVCPVIELISDPELTLLPHTIYEEEGYKATDNYDGDITDRVVRKETYGKITYTVLDSSGNPAVAVREIPYYDPLPPVITLEEGNEITIPVGTIFQDPGYTAEDNVDGDVTGLVETEGEVLWHTPGVYEIVYRVTDGYENTAETVRRVEVVAAQRPEVQYPQKKTIYLTFDDGPGPYTMDLLDTLDRFGVKATFFVVNSGYDRVMREIVRRGHSIGIHSVTHNYEEIYASPEAYFTDLYGMQEIIYESTGKRTWLMRFPGGSSNLVSKFTPGIMTLLSEAVQDAGFRYFDWNVDSNDAGGAKRAQTVVNNVTAGIQQQYYAVVLQHDIHDFSVEAVEDIILWGKDNGYQFLPLTENSPVVQHDVAN